MPVINNRWAQYRAKFAPCCEMLYTKHIHCGQNV